MTMKLYEVRRSLIDGVNGYDLPRGAYVRTEDDLWVARFGTDLKKAGMVPNGTEPDIVEGTVEGSSEKVSEAKAEPAPEKSAEDAPKVTQRAKVQKRGGNKAVMNDESKTK